MHLSGPSINPIDTTSSNIPKKEKCVNPRIQPRSNSQPASKDECKDSLRSRSCDETKFNNLIMPNQEHETNETNKSDVSENSKPLREDPSVVGIKRQGSTTSSRKENGSSGIPLFVKGKPSTKPSPSPNVGKIPASNTAVKTPTAVACRAGTVRPLEIQFFNKKKRFEQLKRELVERQKPVLDLYKLLMQLKDKLELNGKRVALESIKVIDCDANNHPDISAGGEITKVKKSEANPESVANIQIILQQIPSSLKGFCKSLIEKRSEILAILEKISMHVPTMILERSTIENLKSESAELEKSICEILKQQEKSISELAADWFNVLEGTESPLLADKHIKEIHTYLKQKEGLLEESVRKIKHLETQIANVDKLPDKNKNEETISELTKQIKNLEKELETEKRASNDHKCKTKSQDQVTNTLKQKIKDLETRNKEAECKILSLQKKISTIQEQAHKKEHQWTKEREEFQKNIKNQDMLLQKMTLDRNHYETRMKASDEMLTERERKHMEVVSRLKSELEEARKTMIDAKTDRDTMHKKYEVMEEQVVKMGVRNKQALDVVSNKIDQKYSSRDVLNTEREAELYTELLATKVTLKDYEDKIKNYEREKLRFIDTIEQLNGSSDENQTLIGATLVRKEEEITHYQQLIRELEQRNNNRTVENENLKAEVRNLTTRLEAVEEENVKGVSTDLKKMVYEGRAKLNEAMKRSLENEQKIIQYEHDLDKQSKQINEMENLLKVRDGLIGMMKVKKDELQMENESLNKYANEVRELLLEAKEDLRSRNEMVQDLTTNLDCKGKICHKLEKKIKELESTLTVTNEKRFKLQDTLGSVEKELQSTKAHINQMADMHTRYDTGPDLNSSSNGDGPVRIRITVS